MACVPMGSKVRVCVPKAHARRKMAARGGAYSGGQLVVLARLNKTLFGEALAVLQHGGAAAHRFQFLTDDGGAPRLQECEQACSAGSGNTWMSAPTARR